MTSYKIYKIIADANDGTDRFLCYIGSTRNTVIARLDCHEKHYRSFVRGHYPYTSSFDLLKCTWYEISLIEELGDVNRKDAELKEGKYIKQYQQDPNYIVVNKVLVGRTQKEYHEQHKKEIAEYKRQYNKTDKSKNSRKTKIHCPCGSIYCQNDKARHYRTNVHKTYLDSNS